ncbi:iron complex transport system permease protein [Methanomicrobium sp. W14]|uniref:FecCD family ABC transporter permease n=1 Tax=Methanomicrobium sp. W14 TaxID=2817839 RepID=UPI001AE2968F|nr:iron ABC transporter permease [Methanomicrobium sp. W14]MBP2133064.1 iron complex transport system permease protein [Methanomicrobium sp. W14]
MHLNGGEVPKDYKTYTGKKVSIIISGIVVLFLLLILSISVGAVNIPFYDVFQTIFFQHESDQWYAIIWNIRLPQALTGIVAGAGLAVAGVAMQSILRNPLGSPYTLGISNAAAFGAAFSVIILGTGTMHSTGSDAIVLNNPYVTTIMAFIFCLIATAIILMISKVRGSSPEVMVLAGVAIGSLFTAGTMFLQYFADDNQLAAVVFWSFGDVSRADWGELTLMAIVTILCSAYFIYNMWNYNAIDAGDETAKGLGVNVERIRLVGMVVSSFLSAIIVSFLGVIGFVGLVCPHITRRIIGDDNRFLIPGTIVAGGILLLASDTVARLILAPHVLPVAILTAFMGAPVFIYLLIKGYAR